MHDHNYISRCLGVAALVLFVILSLLPNLCLAETETLSGLNLEEFEQKTDDKMMWRGNPFVQPANDVSVSDLRLTGVVYSELKAAAIVNDQIVEEGDKIGYNEILEIEPTRVILRNDNGLFSITLNGGMR